MSNLQGIIQRLKQERDRLARQLEGISAALSAFGAAYGEGSGRRAGKISAAGRARIAAAQRARWAKARGEDPKTNVVRMSKKRTMSPAARKRIAAAQRARWAKARAQESA